MSQRILKQKHYLSVHLSVIFTLLQNVPHGLVFVYFLLAISSGQ